MTRHIGYSYLHSRSSGEPPTWFSENIQDYMESFLLSYARHLRAGRLCGGGEAFLRRDQRVGGGGRPAAPRSSGASWWTTGGPRGNSRRCSRCSTRATHAPRQPRGAQHTTLGILEEKQQRLRELIIRLRPKEGERLTTSRARPLPLVLLPLGLLQS
jgi:hypothetical protein